MDTVWCVVGPCVSLGPTVDVVVLGCNVHIKVVSHQCDIDISNLQLQWTYPSSTSYMCFCPAHHHTPPPLGLRLEDPVFQQHNPHLCIHSCSSQVTSSNQSQRVVVFLCTCKVDSLPQNLLLRVPQNLLLSLQGKNLLAFGNSLSEQIQKKD